MKAFKKSPQAETLNLDCKIGFKKGIIRIWQKMAEYQEISAIKKL